MGFLIFFGVFVIVLVCINIFGGFMVIDCMFNMFKKKSK